MIIARTFLLIQFIFILNSKVQGLEECDESEIGKSCYLDDKREGIVKYDADCIEAVKECNYNLNELSVKFKCGFARLQSLLCCPKSNASELIGVKRDNSDVTIPEKTPNQIAQEKCREFGKRRTDLPIVGEKIINGVKAYLREFPHFVNLGYDRNGEILYECGGVLISKNFVLTAAHCLINSLVQVRLGKVSIGEGEEQSEDFKEETIVTVRSENFIFPDVMKFNAARKINDIGLIKLDSEVETDAIFIHPACLATDEMEDVNNKKTIIISGFGATGRNKPSSVWMLKGNVTEYSDKDCRKVFQKHRFIEYNDNHVCLGGLTAKNEPVDTCRGNFIINFVIS